MERNYREFLLASSSFGSIFYCKLENIAENATLNNKTFSPLSAMPHRTFFSSPLTNSWVLSFSFTSLSLLFHFATKLPSPSLWTTTWRCPEVSESCYGFARVREVCNQETLIDWLAKPCNSLSNMFAYWTLVSKLEPLTIKKPFTRSTSLHLRWRSQSAAEKWSEFLAWTIESLIFSNHHLDKNPNTKCVLWC